MDEQKFWSNFVVSKYFYRSRGTLGGSSGLEVGNEFFKKYEIADEVVGGVTNKLHDLDATSQDHPATGNSPDYTMKPGKQQASMPLIRRYNRHSEAVLQRIKVEGFKTVEDRNKYYSKEIQLDDLENEDAIDRTVALEISDPKQYFESQSLSRVNEGDEEMIDTSNVGKWVSDLSNVSALAYTNVQITLESLRSDNVIQKLVAHSRKRKHDTSIAFGIQQDSA